MSLLRRWSWLFLLLLIVLILLAWRYCRPGSPTSGPTTELRMEVFGGFAYIPSARDNRLHIAYLKDTNVPGCEVPQLGTDLRVIDGEIVEPANAPASKTFSLLGTVVTFPDLEANNLPLTINRGSQPASPSSPPNPNDPAQWEDLKWVPRISDNFPSSSLNPNWPQLVNGRVVVRGGTMKALHPSDVIAKDSVFNFTSNGSSQTPAFTQAITDRTEYAVQVPNDQVVMHLTGHPTVTRIVVRPRQPGAPVLLRLMGRHKGGALPTGAVLHEHCAFYQLLQPIPDQKDWLIPHHVESVVATGSIGRPSPGLFCPGDWF
jgi:hypothetical protein